MHKRLASKFNKEVLALALFKSKEIKYTKEVLNKMNKEALLKLCETTYDLDMINAQDTITKNKESKEVVTTDNLTDTNTDTKKGNNMKTNTATNTDTNTATNTDTKKGNNMKTNTATNTDTKEITAKSTIKAIKEVLTSLKIEFNPKDNKAVLLQLYTDNKELTQIREILESIKKDDKKIKALKEDKETLENNAVPLMLNLIKAKSDNNATFNALSKKNKIKELKKLLGSKNNLIKDTLTFLLHNNLSYSNDINIANIRGINSLIAKSIAVKSRVNHSMDNTAIKEVLATIRKEVKSKEDKELKALKKDSAELKALKENKEIKEIIKEGKLKKVEVLKKSA